MPYNSFKVANCLLTLAEQEGLHIDPLKLLKLVYISHGWSFPLRGKALITDRIEAWQYGPVVPALYRAVKDFRYSPVQGPLADPDRNNNISEEDQELLAAVYRAYGRYTGGQLSNLTHAEGTPWATIWHRYGRNTEIPDDLIAEHYRQLAAERSTTANNNTRA